MISDLFRKAACATDTLHSSMERKLIKPSELDIYYEPVEMVEIVERSNSPAFLYDNVSTARKKLTGAFSGVLTTHEKLSNFFGSLEDKIKNAYKNTIEDPYFLLTPGVVTLATVSGAAVAGKGRRPFKRSFYALIFGTTALAVSYPERSMDIATTGYYHTTGSLSNLIYQLRNKESITEKAMKEIQPDAKEEKVEEELTSMHNDSEIMIKEEEVPAIEKIEEELKIEKYDVEVAVTEDNDGPITDSSQSGAEGVLVVGNEITEQIHDVTTKEDELIIAAGGTNSSPRQEELKVETIEVIKANEDGSSDEGDIKNTVVEESTELKAHADEPIELKVDADYGQSSSEDNDMYSTRS